MKNMKKLFAMLLTVAMVLSMATSVFAHTISINGDTAHPSAKHEYSVYQIFTGELVGGKLVDVKYGSADETKTGDVPESELAAITNAEAYAKTLDIANLKKYGTLKGEGEGANNWTLTDVPTGYYLIVDETDKTIAAGDSFSKYIVKVVNDVQVTPKSEATKVTKTTYDEATAAKKMNEAGLGNFVPYTAKATIPTYAATCDDYYFVFRDKMDAGLTFNKDIKVTIGGEEAVEGTDYNVVYNSNGYTFELGIVDPVANAGKEVVINYSATVNSDAVIVLPNKNDVDVKYTNKPYWDGTGKPNDVEGKPGVPVEYPNEVFGTTPPDETRTYTTALVLNKKDDKGNALAGATFNLVSNDAKQTVFNKSVYYEPAANGTWYLLKDGTYTQTAPTGTEFKSYGIGDAKTTQGYLKAADAASVPENAVKVEGLYYVPANATAYDGKEVFYKELGTAASYAGTETYKQVTSDGFSAKDAKVDITMTTGADGVLTFKDLGEGTYTLTEVHAPNGYNYVEPITFKVQFNANTEKFELVNSADGKVYQMEDGTLAGAFATDLVDTTGAVLPETGGMGTTMFYTIGGFLVAAAVVLLITKRRVAGQF